MAFRSPHFPYPTLYPQSTCMVCNVLPLMMQHLIVIQTSVGRCHHLQVSFPTEHIVSNMGAFTWALLSLRPRSLGAGSGADGEWRGGR